MTPLAPADGGGPHPAERQRDAALRFLSHDARSSASAILGLIELARLRTAAAPDAAVLHAIEDAARDGLARCDAFLALARAESRPLRIEPLDLAALLQQAVDGAWQTAARQGLALRIGTVPAAAPLRSDRALLVATLDDLLAGFIAAGRPGGEVECRLQADPATHGWHLSVHDPRPLCPQAADAFRLARTAAGRLGAELAIGSHAVTLALPRPTNDKE